MIRKETRLAGLLLELEIDCNDTQCTVTNADGLSSSLEALDALGGFYRSDDTFHRCEPAAIDRAMKWALANGY